MSESSIRAPAPSEPVYKDQCLFTFQTPEMERGLNVCLHCYQGFAPYDPATETNYTFLHENLTGHGIYLNIQKFFQEDVQREQLQKRMKLDKLQILEEDEESYYTHQYQIFYSGKNEYVPITVESTTTGYNVSGVASNIAAAVAGVLSASSADLKSNVEAWEQEINPCVHSRNVSKFVPENYTLANKCSSCDLEENLWLCLHCGNIGCGREQFGGLKGNSHALAHYTAHKDHPVAVKLGSLSLTQGKADCYCYECQDEVKVPNLAQDLAVFGINSNSFAERNEKTLTELNIQQNLTWQFNMESENGELYLPIFGEGLVGLKNLGNSCYLNSTLQLLSHLKCWQQLFFKKDVYEFPREALVAPYKDLYLQLVKIFNGLVCSKYSVPSLSSTDAIKWQKGLNLHIFKSLIGQNNAEFRSQHQQDASEFLLYFLDQVESYYYKNKALKKSSVFAANPTDFFKFVVSSKLSLIGTEKYKVKENLEEYLSLNVKDEVDHVDEDGKTHYKKVDIGSALQDYFESNDVLELDGELFCKTNKIVSYPEVLLVQVQRAKLVNWVPTKTDVPVFIANGEIDLSRFALTQDAYKSLKESPLVIPDEEKKSSLFEPNQDVMNALLQMGFPEARCKKACYNVGNSLNPEDAMNWLFAHMDDPDIDEPLVISEEPAKKSNEPTNEEISNLTAMGFAEKLVRKALILNNKNAEAAVEWLFSNPTDDGELEDAKSVSEPSTEEKIKTILEKGSEGDGKYVLKGVVCHKGSSIHTGHYVAFLKTRVEGRPQWVLYNDEKVVLAEDKKSYEEMEKNGYLYLFIRKNGPEDDISGTD